MSSSSTKILIALIAIVIVGISGTAAWIMSQPKSDINKMTDSMSNVTMKSQDTTSKKMTSSAISMPSMDNTKPADPNQKEASAIKISMAELATHNTNQSCYVAYKKEVYDITSFLPKHPGGEKKPLKYCGKITDDFSEMHSGGSFDTGKVASMLKERLIGVLE
jgi:cytochrome b involved in lipid metabolism